MNDDGLRTLIEESNTDLGRLQVRLPSPIARTSQRVREVGHGRGAFERADALIGLAEVTVKVLTALAVKAYLLDGAPDQKFRAAAARLGRMSFGHWINLMRLSLKGYDQGSAVGLPADLHGYYMARRTGTPEVSDAIRALCTASRGELKPPSGKLTNGTVLGFLCEVRNLLRHGGKLPDEDWGRIHRELDLLVRDQLTQLKFLETYELLFVKDVVVSKSGDEDRFQHRGLSCQGLQIEPAERIGSQSLQDKVLYICQRTDSGELGFAMDLSPLALLLHCDGCSRHQVFVLDKIEGKRIGYVSHQCGHHETLYDIASEFTDITNYVRGLAPLRTLFAGRVLGRETGGLSAVASEAERRRAKALELSAREHLELQSFDEAEVDLRQALRLDPDQASRHHALALTLLLRGDPTEKAVEALREAVRVDPDFGPAQFALAVVFAELGAPSRARMAVDRAVSAEPANHDYRRLRDRLPDISDDPHADPLTQPIDASTVERLGSRAEELLRAEQAGTLRLRNWTDGLLPWSFLRPAPLQRSAALTLVLLLIVLAVQGEQLNWPRFFEQLSIMPIIFLGLSWPFFGVRFLERGYERLLPVVTVPEDVFRRFYLRQMRKVLGATAEDDGSYAGWRRATRVNRPQLAIAGTFFLMLLPFQYYCADDSPYDGSLAASARYFVYVFEALSVSWCATFAVLSPRMIPEFSTLPQRYFLSMPDAVSLRPLGSMFLVYSVLAAVWNPFILAQHYVFQTHDTVFAISVTYVTMITLLFMGLMIMPQVAVRRMLRRLRDRKMTEYSFQVEQAFERFVKAPGPDSFERLQLHRQYLSTLAELEIRGLPDRQRWLPLTLGVVVVATVGLYLYLVEGEHWLFTRTVEAFR